MVMKKFENVNAYIHAAPKESQKLLKELRALIKKAAPKAVESISYGMPGYKLNGKPLVYFGGYKTHIGFYPTPSGLITFQKELSSYKTGKGTAQFPLDKPLPKKLIREIVQFRIKENQVRVRT
jgi:uncharacterized protein YdhG (YjbR/CyaY superfamily)